MSTSESLSLALAGNARLQRAFFWIRRYGPAELACLVTMLAASTLASSVTDSPPLLAASAIGGATVGFYGVLVTTVVREQAKAIEPGTTGRVRRIAVRTLLLLVAEFGPAEILDTFLLRPALMMGGVILLQNDVWGLLAGKIVADVLFYALSASGYRITVVAGVRLPRKRTSRDTLDAAQDLVSARGCNGTTGREAPVD